MKKILFFLLAVAVFASCNSSQFKGFEQAESGLYYKIHVSGGDTVKALEGDVMTVLLNYRTLENKPVDTNYISQPIEIRMRPSIYKGDIFEGLGMLSVGDSATFVVSADSFFTKLSGSPMPPTLDSGSFFYIDVKVEKIQNSAEMARLEQERLALLQEAETSLLKSYLTENNVTVAPDSNGMYVVKSKMGKGKLIQTGSYAKMQLKITALNSDEVLYDTKEHMPEGVEMMVGTGYFGIGFDICVQGAKVGDVFRAIVPSSMAFGERGAEGIVPPYTTLIYDCELVAAYTEEEYAAITKKKNDERLAKQNAEIKDFAAKNNFPKSPDADGIYKKMVKEGKGELVGTAKGVKVHYTGKLLNGTKFDSSLDRGEPFSFIVGAGEVIPGWDKVVAEMKIGEKAVFIIPSAMAYGNQAAGSIPPFSPLTFEIEVLELAK